jgi:predicted ABC-class ATPase
VTQRAQKIALDSGSARANEGDARFPQPRARAPQGNVLDPRNKHGHFRISASNRRYLVFGEIEIDLSDLEQLSETAQTRAMGRAMHHAKRYLDGKTTLREAVERVMRDIRNNGLDVLDDRCIGDLAAFRREDLVAAFNRVRGLTASQPH